MKREEERGKMRNREQRKRQEKIKREHMRAIYINREQERVRESK